MLVKLALVNLLYQFICNVQHFRPSDKRTRFYFLLCRIYSWFAQNFYSISSLNTDRELAKILIFYTLKYQMCKYNGDWLTKAFF